MDDEFIPNQMTPEDLYRLLHGGIMQGAYEDLRKEKATKQKLRDTEIIRKVLLEGFVNLFEDSRFIDRPGIVQHILRRKFIKEYGTGVAYDEAMFSGALKRLVNFEETARCRVSFKAKTDSVHKITASLITDTLYRVNGKHQTGIVQSAYDVSIDIYDKIRSSPIKKDALRHLGDVNMTVYKRYGLDLNTVEANIFETLTSMALFYSVMSNVALDTSKTLNNIKDAVADNNYDAGNLRYGRRIVSLDDYVNSYLHAELKKEKASANLDSVIECIINEKRELLEEAVVKIISKEVIKHLKKTKIKYPKQTSTGGTLGRTRINNETFTAFHRPVPTSFGITNF